MSCYGSRESEILLWIKKKGKPTKWSEDSAINRKFEQPRGQNGKLINKG